MVILTTAFILINGELGAEQQIIENLKKIDCVKEIQGSFGAYDIIVKAESNQTESLRECITWKIRKLQNIRSTLTLMVSTTQQAF